MTNATVAEGGGPMAASSRQYPSAGKAWLSTAVIFVLTAIAMADRMAISILIGPIKAEFGIGDFQASLLIGFAFMLFYVIFLLPVGIAADRFSRAKVLAVCLFVWSVATVLCGFAVGFVSLFLARMLMGAGEAGIGPCSHGIIGNSFPRESLAKPLAIQGIGYQVGPALGIAAAGAIMGAGAAGAFESWPVLGDMSHWRVAFILIAIPGFLALLLIPFLHEQKRDTSTIEKEPAAPIKPFLEANTALVVLILGIAGVSAMAGATVMSWAAEYMQRSLGVSAMEAGSALGAVMLISAFAGQGTFSVIVDWMAKRGHLDAPIKAAIIPTALTIPLGWAAMAVDETALFFPLLFGFMLFAAPFNTVANTSIQQIAPRALRSRLSALMILVISIIAFVFAPSLVGALSEYVLGEENLGQAMQWVMTGSMIVTLGLMLAARGRLLRYMQANGDKLAAE